MWVSNSGSGLEKRQCSLQLAFSLKDNTGENWNYLSGTGKRILADELASYHKDVDVNWHEHAWVDTKDCMEWVQKTLTPVVANINDFVPRRSQKNSLV